VDFKLYKNSMALAQKQTWGSVDRREDPEITQPQQFLTKESKIYTGKKTPSSTNCAGEN
jgi:hypothetical protein